MVLTWQQFILPLAFLVTVLSVSCASKSNRGESVVLETPERITDDRLGRILRGTLGDDLDPSKNPELKTCQQGCHQHRGIDVAVVGTWIKGALETFETCKGTKDILQKDYDWNLLTEEQLNCLNGRANSSGILRTQFHRATSGGSATDPLATLAAKGMPPGRQVPSEWRQILYGLTFDYQGENFALLDEDLARYQTAGAAKAKPLEFCKQSISDDLKSYIRNLDARGKSWAIKNLVDPNIRMFGCAPRTDPLACFSTGEYPDRNKLANSAAKSEIGHQIKLVREIGSVRGGYWMRNSPDGRFVAVDGALYRLAAAPGEREWLEIQGADPTFTPDNHGFVIAYGPSREGGMASCNVRIFDDPDALDGGELSRFDPDDFFVSYPPRTIAALKRWCRGGILGDYQSLAKDAGGGFDRIVFPLYSAVDSGVHYPDSPVGGFSTPEAAFAVAVVDPNSSKLGSDEPFELNFLPTTNPDWPPGEEEPPLPPFARVSTPHMGDFIVSPSGRLTAGRISGSLHGQTPPRHSGYTIRTVEAKVEELDGKPTLTGGTSKSLATLCMRGRKAVFSYDERFIVTHSYITRHEAQEYGYDSSNDPEFAKLKLKSADIWLADLYTGKSYRLTSVGANRDALYPNFRADGWIYFVLRDNGTNEEHIIATDAAIRLARANPISAN